MVAKNATLVASLDDLDRGNDKESKEKDGYAYDREKNSAFLAKKMDATECGYKAVGFVDFCQGMSEGDILKQPEATESPVSYVIAKDGGS